jgi:hypothetical protein
MQMKKLGRELKRAERNVRHGVQRVAVKLQLDSERDWSRDALASAEQGLAEVNAAVQTAMQIQSEVTQSAEAAHHDTDAFGAINGHVNEIAPLVQKLLEAQTRIVAEEKITREERGKVSSIPNEMDNADEGERQGKEACQKAVASAKIITDMLVEVRTHVSRIQAAQQEMRTLLSTDRKESAEQQLHSSENVEHKGRQEPQPVNSAPPAFDGDYDDCDASPAAVQEAAAVVVHAQPEPQLSPRSDTLLSRLEAVQTKLTAEQTKKTEAEALEDAAVFTGLLVDIHAMKRIVKSRPQPQSNVAVARQLTS